MSRTVYVNGTFFAQEDARVSVFDRGFLFGDGVYEVIPVLNGRIVETAHAIERLNRSLGEIGMAWPCSQDEFKRVLEDLQEQKARFTLAIIDACRDNPFKGKGRSIGGRGLQPVNPATGQMVLYSAGAGQQALDRLNDNDRDPNGLFTRILLKEMNRPGVSADRMLRCAPSWSGEGAVT